MRLVAKPTNNPVVVLREEFDDYAILFHPDSAAAVGINPVGVVVWKLLDGQHTLAEIVQEVQNHFSSVPETVAQEIDSFVTQLVENGFAGYPVATDSSAIETNI